MNINTYKRRLSLTYVYIALFYTHTHTHIAFNIIMSYFINKDSSSFFQKWANVHMDLNAI